MTGWKIIRGNSPILLVASHSFPQMRKKSIKKADINTGVLAQ